MVIGILVRRRQVTNVPGDSASMITHITMRLRTESQLRLDGAEVAECRQVEIRRFYPALSKTEGPWIAVSCYFQSDTKGLRENSRHELLAANDAQESDEIGGAVANDS
jgi:hypothetical protein